MQGDIKNERQETSIRYENLSTFTPITIIDAKINEGT